MPILAGSGHRPPAGIAKLKHERIGIGKKRSRSQSEAVRRHSARRAPGWSKNAVAAGSADYELKPDRALQGGTRGVRRHRQV
jgi:hypothetical protein